ncbi:MAG: sugar ABC transporter permease, partial [Candidatus Heimdallarchaeota archaeon]|nr:sugar ABC transporter permease [Candidatus Heimdallarchaeota archaeon]
MKKPSKKSIISYFLVSPYLVHLILFVSFPVIFSVVLTFHKWNIISEMQYVGFDNYIRLFQDRLFWKALVNTLTFLIIHIPLQIIIALALAYFLDQKILFKGFFRATFFLPVVISGVVVTMVWQQLYGFDSGLINKLLVSIGLGKVEWLTNKNIAMISIA